MNNGRKTETLAEFKARGGKVQTVLSFETIQLNQNTRYDLFQLLIQLNIHKRPKRSIVVMDIETYNVKHFKDWSSYKNSNG